jgi:hypothetical protein
LSSLFAFIAFSLVASSVYVLSGLLDLNADRAHSRNRLLPFASGDVLIAHGSILALALLVAGLVIALVARFPHHNGFATVYYSASAISKSMLAQFIPGQFTQKAHHLILVGSTGTGKTHIYYYTSNDSTGRRTVHTSHVYGLFDE